MVWGLFPADSLSGEDKYYIFLKGNYKVGRKGCDIIINKDKGVSRIHAEIFVDEMIPLDPLQNKSSNKFTNTKIRIKDCSKYGTFVNKNTGSKEKVHEFPHKETVLKEGDLLSFGTGNATYRFCYVPLVLFVCCTNSFRANDSLEDKVSSIGACISSKLCEECTHVLVHHHMPMTEELLDAIVAKKPLVDDSWLQIVAEKNIRTEFPGFNSHVTTLTVEGVCVELANLETRENCLGGYTFLLDSSCKYKYGIKLQLLLEAGGAKTLSIERFCSSNQDSECRENKRVIYVIPRRSEDCSNSIGKLSLLSRMNEKDLICAVLSGHLDPFVLISPAPPVLISSSCSTDETVVADSDVEAEAETAASSHATIAINSKEAPASINHAASREDSLGTHFSNRNNTIVNRPEDNHDTGFKYRNSSIENRSGDSHGTGFRDGNINMASNREKDGDRESENSDIIYNQDLVVRYLNAAHTISSTANNGVVNFKRFRKTNTQSGNSFGSLIPFSKYPYKDFDCGNEEMVDSVKEEKKRKQLEAIAEDLFNHEKGTRRGVAGALHGLLTRG